MENEEIQKPLNGGARGEARGRVETRLVDLHLGQTQEPAMQAQGKVTEVDFITNQSS